MESDPIGLSAGINTYAYVWANPISDVDPTAELGSWRAAASGGLDLALQLAANGGNFKCVDFDSVLISAAIGAVTPGSITTREAFLAGSSARTAVSTLEGQLNSSRTAARVAKIQQSISRNEAAVEQANTTIIPSFSKFPAKLEGRSSR